MVRFSRRLSRWKHPDYTGPNRCLPCTVANVVLAVAFAVVAVTALWTVGVLRSGGDAAVAGAVVLGCSILAIYLRGYLVPGTPDLTKRYFPRWLLSAFGKAPAAGGSGFDPGTELRAAGLVVDDGDDLRLHPPFDRAWRIAIDDIGNSAITVEGEITQRLAALAGFEPGGVELVDGPRSFRAWYDDELIASWESRGACIADVAAADVAPDYDSTWYGRPLAIQAELLGALRLFLERCPVCEGAVTLSHEVVSSCCYDYDVVASTCNGCDSRLFEVEVDDGFADDG